MSEDRQHLSNHPASDENKEALAARREGMEVEEDEEEVELDSDIEEQANAHRAKRQVDVEQKCKWWGVYALGLLLAMVCEFIILLPSYHIWVLWVALTYAVIWLIISALSIIAQHCPGRKKPYSTLASGLHVAALAAFVGGVLGAYYFSYAWYFDKGHSYSNVSPVVNPSTFARPTFLTFAPGAATSTRSPVVLTKGSTTYCLSPMTGLGETSKLAYYWAVDTNCCSGGGTVPMTFTCQYFGPRNADAVISAEVYADPVPSAYIEATLLAEDVHDFKTSDSALFVKLMTQYDHDQLMKWRRLRAYICVFVAAFAWPIMWLPYALFEWAHNKISKKRDAHVL